LAGMAVPSTPVMPQMTWPPGVTTQVRSGAVVSGDSDVLKSSSGDSEKIEVAVRSRADVIGVYAAIDTAASSTKVPTSFILQR